MTTAGAPAVSVLVPCFNAEASIGRALGSVLAETTVPLEVIAVDDASTDGTVEVLRGIAARDDRVVVIPLPVNGGVSNARNRGLEAVRGTWLTLLDADDRFMPGGLASLFRAAVTTGALAVVGQQVWSDGRHYWLGPLYDIPDIRLPGRTSLAARPGLLYYASPHGKLVHRSTIDGLRFSGRVLGDQPWVIRALLRSGDRLEVIGETVYEWIRAAPVGAGPSITAATRSSASRGVEAAGVAIEALAAVTAELERTVADPRDRHRVAAAYAERLVRSDLGVHVARGLARGDPTLAELFDAIAGFVAAAPPATLAANAALAPDLVVPPLRRWSRVRGPARPAFWRMVDACLPVQPDLAEHGRDRLERWSLRRAIGARTTGEGLPTRAALTLSGVVQAAPLAPPRAGRWLRRHGIWPA
jgi:hypothetical protein